MSGGFFRGTSADQDTRFSNKQAKLLKSQKFAPELEHLVDMSKVNMDVLRPWIATRVTDLLGFEDEVLINFIYGLLDVKEVNGKEIQISLTGFMEKNTVKFMRELWTLLLSAQNNASGVPQQFLDAKQEEARKKKEEADAIETQRKKDREMLELERSKKMEGGVDKRSSNAAAGPSSRRASPRVSSEHPDDERGADQRNGVTAGNRVSSPIDSADSDSSLSPRFGERDGSRSVSNSPKARGRSISSERGGGNRSPQRRPITSRRRSRERSLSPRRRSPYSRRGSRSNSPHRSRSPVSRRVRSPYRRSRSPARRRSPPPFRSRRSPSPFRGRRSPYRRRRSPTPPRRRRSPTPPRRRRLSSPGRNRRSPSPIRRRRSPSPMRRRMSPVIRRRRSPSPARRRSPSPGRASYRRSPRNRYASPAQRRSPVRSGRRSPPVRRRSPSSSDRSSASPIRRDSRSPIGRTTKQQRSPLKSHQERTRSDENLSPAPQQSSGSEGSLQKERKNGNDYRKRAPALSPSPEKSPQMSESPPGARNAREKRRLSSPLESPAKRPKEKNARYGSSSPSRKPREQKLRRDSPKESEEEEDVNHRPKSLERRSRDTSRISKQKISPTMEDYSPERGVSGQKFTESRSHLDNTESRTEQEERKSEKSSGRGSKVPIVYKDSLPGEAQQALKPGEGKRADDKNRSHSNNTKDSEQHRKPGSLHSSVEMVDRSNLSGGLDSGSEDSDKGRNGDKEKRKSKRSERQEVTSDDDYSDDSAVEDRKEAKKRRKEEKKLRKEKKRRRREERRRRREERRAEKQKVKNFSDASGSDGEHVNGRGFHSSDNEDEAVQKKLEIELREKALESLKAKKGISQ